MSVKVEKDQNVFHVTWISYADHFRQLMAALMGGTEFSDVTLVCDDKQEIQAHKFILSTCSSVFRNILSKNPKNLPVYLKGTQSQDMIYLLQYMYLGEAIVPKERMESFFNFACFFKVKDLSEYDLNTERKKQEAYEKVQLEKKRLAEKAKMKRVIKPRKNIQNHTNKREERNMRPTMYDWQKEVGDMMLDVNETLEKEKVSEFREQESENSVSSEDLMEEEVLIEERMDDDSLTVDSSEDEDDEPKMEEIREEPDPEVIKKKLPKSTRHEGNDSLREFLDDIQSSTNDSSHLLTEGSETFSKFFDISDLCGDEISQNKEEESEPKEAEPKDPNKKYVCKWCNGERGRGGFKNYTLRTFEELSDHFRKDHKAQGPIYACNKCDYQDKGINQLGDHCKLMHTKGGKDQRPDDNDESEPIRDDTSNSVSEHKCPKCEKKYSSASQLGIHLTHAHKPMKDLVCQWCGKKFKQNHHLIVHVKTIHKGYACAAVKCSYQANSLERYQAHIKSSHTNSTQCKYVCSDCDFQNNSLPKFLEHVQKFHSKHQAEDVDYEEVELEEDIEKNEEEKKRKIKRRPVNKKNPITIDGKYNCRLCTVVCSASEDLNLHIRRDHEKLTVSCDLCHNFQYFSEAAVKMHKMAKH